MYYKKYSTFTLITFLMALNACSSTNYAPISSTSANNHTFNKNNFSAYLCNRPEQYENNYIGNGECVDFVKLCSKAPSTKHWKQGGSVFGKSIPQGTAIATFKRGKYPSKNGYHAAIFSHQTKEGIFVWDQWKGKKVHLRLIRANQSHKKPANNANSYSVIGK